MLDKLLRTLAPAFFLLAGNGAGAAEPCTPKLCARPDVEIEASLSTSDSSGEQWSLHITRNGNGYFRYFSTVPRGELIGDFLIADKSISQLMTQMEAQSFDGLPRQISPAFVVLHAPEYTVSVQVGAKRHTVRVREPENLDKTEELARFAEVWNLVWSRVPIRPPGLPSGAKP